MPEISRKRSKKFEMMFFALEKATQNQFLTLFSWEEVAVGATVFEKVGAKLYKSEGKERRNCPPIIRISKAEMSFHFVR